MNFNVGDLVWWKTSGYGHSKRIPGRIVAFSNSGKRVRVRYPVKNWTDGEVVGENLSWVAHHMLEKRDAP